MDFNIKEIVGKVLNDSGGLIGTGFIINNDHFITAKHNVHDGMEDVEEKEIQILFNNKIYVGMTLNLKEAYGKRVDFVLIKLEEEIYDIEIPKIIKTINNLKNFNFKIYGYPKEINTGVSINGKIISNSLSNGNIDCCLEIQENNILSSYKGLSGSPIIIDGYIVGIVIQQGTESNLFGISFNLIDKIMNNEREKNFKIEKIELKRTLSVDSDELDLKLNSTFFHEYLDKSLKQAGPRYNCFNIENETYKNLLNFSGTRVLYKEVKEVIKKLDNFSNNIGNYILSDKNRGSVVFMEENLINMKKIRERIVYISKELKDVFINGFSEEKNDFLNKINIFLDKIIKEIKIIFEKELVHFEETHGKGNYENRHWRGYMASDMCIFPCTNLDILKELEVYLENLKDFFQINPGTLIFSQSLLLKGQGGTGKTHCLCELVSNSIKNKIPSLLFFGQYFKDKSPEETILEKLDMKELNFDDFLYKINIIGERKGKAVLLCIDGINETENKNYWNDYLISFMEKIAKYNFIKLIISCRSLYLSEILNKDVYDRFFTLEQIGFEGIEENAISKYFKYYGLETPMVSKLQKEFKTPLFLKLYCEILQEKEGDFDINGLSDLFGEFLTSKNELISKRFNKYISPKDKIIFKCIKEISRHMGNHEISYLKWDEAKEVVIETLKKNSLDEKILAKSILDELISENILKENIDGNETISFSFERFFDYLEATNVMEIVGTSEFLKKVDKYSKDINLYKGTLELLSILYKEKYRKEIMNSLDLHSDLFYELTLMSLFLRKNDDIDTEVQEIVEYCLYSKNQKLINFSFFTLLELSTRKDCILNANYFHSLFEHLHITRRDLFLGNILLKSYNSKGIVDRLLKNMFLLNSEKLEFEISQLWSIILCWFLSLNDIYIRDLASKGLTKLLKEHPELVFFILSEFKDIEDDYIHERLWQIIYSSLILNKNLEILKKVIKYIYEEYIESEKVPTSILIRDVFMNISEFSYHLGVLEYKIEKFRPPYKSFKIEKINLNSEDIEESKKRLFWNCTESDFAIYTIPGRVMDYGFAKKDVGKIIFNEIINSGYYNEKIKNFDNYIDHTYGSLRYRDESVERISKKYQKIFLNKILGQIYDNYKYAPRYNESYDDQINIIPFGIGNDFREIDLTLLPNDSFIYDFKGRSLEYDYRLVKKLSDIEWFKKEDLKYKNEKLLLNKNNDDNFLLLKGFFETKEIIKKIEKYPQKLIWSQVNSYLLKKEDREVFKVWVKDKHFWGRWMPIGGNFFEGQVGEFPWCSYFRNYLDYYEKSKITEKIPFELFPTAHIFNHEKDSEFCNTEIGRKFLFPSSKFFEDLDLNWNGGNVYYCNSQKMFIIGTGIDRTIYVNKKLLDEYLERLELSIVWTVLGEKQILTEGRGFLGSTEFSESYIYEDYEIHKNHHFPKINDPIIS